MKREWECGVTGVPAVTECCALGSDTCNVRAAQEVLWTPSPNMSFMPKLDKCHGVPGWKTVQEVPST